MRFKYDARVLLDALRSYFIDAVEHDILFEAKGRQVRFET